MQSNLRPARRLLILGLLVPAFFLVWAIGSKAAKPPGCGTFKSQAEAEDYFVTAGGGVEHAVGKLDPDHDGAACEGLSGPYAGFATLGYNKKRDFFYGTVTLPAPPAGGEYPCLVGNRHFPDAPRRLNVYKVEGDGSGKPIFHAIGLGAEARPSSGRLLWRADRKHVVPGRYYAEFEERIRSNPYGGTECPSFRSEVVHLPTLPRR